MYSKIVSIHDIQPLRENIDPESKYFTDANLSNIIATCSGMLDRAVVKCFLGLIQKAKDAKDNATVLKARNLLNQFEAGVLKID